MGNGDGCLPWIGIACFIVALVIWTNEVDTIVIKEQIPPPQDSWDVVYPKFRDEVSSQLLNTQEMVGVVLNDSSYLKTQSAEIQQSLDILLNELGILEKKSEEESGRQKIEQRITAVASLILGWLLAAFVPTEDTLVKFRNKFSRKSKLEDLEKKGLDISSSNERDSSEHQGFNKSSDETKYANASLWELIQIDPADRVFVIIIFILGIAGVILFFLGYYVL